MSKIYWILGRTLTIALLIATVVNAFIISTLLLLFTSPSSQTFLSFLIARPDLLSHLSIASIVAPLVITLWYILKGGYMMVKRIKRERVRREILRGIAGL